jgi:hypothetical protein
LRNWQSLFVMADAITGMWCGVPVRAALCNQMPLVSCKRAVLNIALGAGGDAGS